MITLITGWRHSGKDTLFKSLKDNLNLFDFYSLKHDKLPHYVNPKRISFVDESYSTLLHDRKEISRSHHTFQGLPKDSPLADEAIITDFKFQEKYNMLNKNE